MTTLRQHLVLTTAAREAVDEAASEALDEADSIEPLAAQLPWAVNGGVQDTLLNEVAVW
jgi:hypothetical protein